MDDDHDQIIILLQQLITSPKTGLFIITCLSLLLVSWIMLWSKQVVNITRRSRSRTVVPAGPGPMKLPIIGNLHNVAAAAGSNNNLVPYRSMAELAKKYGPVMHLQLGKATTIVLSSPEAASQAMRTHDIHLASRRAVELLMNSLLCFRPIREREVSRLVADISFGARKVVNLRRVIRSNSCRVFRDIVFGKSANIAADHLDTYLKLTREIIDQSLGGLISTVSTDDDDQMFPSSLKLLLTHAEVAKLSRFKQLRAEADAVLKNVITQHMQAHATSEEEDQDVLHLLLNLKDFDRQLGFPLTVDNVKAFLQDLMLIGMESSAIITEWAMAELLKNPILLHKATKEVRGVFRNNKVVDEAGLDQIKYLKLVVQETLRLHPWSPLTPLVSRSVSKEIKTDDQINIDGHEIPAGAQILINEWWIMRNPKYWKYPEAFFPERFIQNGNNAVRFGNRTYPGVAMGLVNVELVLANLLISYDWEMPNGQRNEELSLDEVPGIAIAKKEPLQAIPMYQP